MSQYFVAERQCHSTQHVVNSRFLRHDMLSLMILKTNYKKKDLVTRIHAYG
jgi:hypothetical protein